MLFIAADLWPLTGLLRTILFYNIFMVMGFCYYRNCMEQIVIWTGIVSAAVVLIMVNVFHIDFCPMQSHKFPPDTLFLFYNVFVVCLFSLIMKLVTIPEWNFLRIWNERGYTLYLYQSIVFFVVFGVHLAIVKKIPSAIMQAIICSTLMFVLSTAVSCFTYKLELKIVHFVKRVIDHSR